MGFGGDTLNLTPILGPDGNPITTKVRQEQLTPSTSAPVPLKAFNSALAGAVSADRAVDAASEPALGDQSIEDFDAALTSQSAAMHPEDAALQATSRQKVGALPDPFAADANQVFEPDTLDAGGNPVTNYQMAPAPPAAITQQQAQDRTNKFAKEEEARTAQATRDDLARLEVERQGRIDAAMKRMATAADEYEKKSKLTSYREDRPLINGILEAIAVGMGSYGASQTGSPNFALQIINKRMDEDMERKKLAMESAFNKYKQAGLAPDQIAAWAKGQNESLMARQTAQLNTIEKLGGAALSRFPVAEQAFKQATAERRQKQEQQHFERVKQLVGTTETAGIKEAVTSGDKMDSRRIPTTKEEGDFATAEENAKLAAELEELWKDPKNRFTPEQLREIKDRENAMMGSQHKEGESPISAKFGQGLRAIGILPTSQYPEDMNENQIKAYLLDQRLTHSHLFAEAGTGWTSNPEARQMFTESRVASAADRPATVDMKVGNSVEANKSIFRHMQEGRAGQQAAKFKGKEEGIELARQTSKASAVAKDPNATPAQKKAAKIFLDQLNRGAK
jgi:hypothetical protein